MKKSPRTFGDKIVRIASISIIFASLFLESCNSKDAKSLIGADLSESSTAYKIAANSLNTIKFDSRNFKSADLNSLIDYKSNYIKDNEEKLIEIPYAKVLASLDLTNEQSTLIRKYAKSFYDLETSILVPIMDYENGIIIESNNKISGIQSSYSSGIISGSKAKEEISKINIETIESLKNNPFWASAKVALENSIETYIHSVNSILSQDQMNTFVAKLSKDKEAMRIISN